MSASLVGSEMCIRDRPLGPPRCSLGGLALAAPVVGVRGGGSARAGQPVSYTHLTLPTICSV
eukprot:14802434-Alexandrium_andersonii.AAC.1